MRRNRQLEAYFRHSIRKRHEEFLASVQLDTSSLVNYERSASQLRAQLQESLGGWRRPPQEARASVEYLADMEPGRLYRVQVWVIDDVKMPALMLVPHGAEKAPRPVVICVHGYSGSPEWAMGFATPGQDNYMNAAARRLAGAGDVVIAPYIVCGPPGFGKDRVRLDRLARLAGEGLLGFEIFELSRVVDYLETRPEILPGRIGVYGISQGGKSTLFLAALDTRVAAAVCSCYFNNRWNKMLEGERLAEASKQEGISYVDYLDTDEDDKFNPVSAPLFPDHLLGALICPRPFMVEIGRHDPIVYWRDAVEEFGRVHQIYRRLGVDERAKPVVADQGGHEMFYEDAKKFLDTWLRDPPNG